MKIKWKLVVTGWGWIACDTYDFADIVGGDYCNDKKTKGRYVWILLLFLAPVNMYMGWQTCHSWEI